MLDLRPVPLLTSPSSPMNVPPNKTYKVKETTERVTNNLDNCNFRNELIDTFTVDHLLSYSVKIMSCLSSIDGVGLPYFEKYLNPPEKKNVICILLCDGVRFQGYIVNIKELKIIHINSFRWDHPKNPTSLQIAKVLFENSNPTFESLFSERKQFDANSCGVWLVAGMSSYLINPPEISDRCNAFDIAYNLLERNPIIQKVESLSPQFFTEDQMKKIASADFLIHLLTNDPERSVYFRLSPPKGILSLLQIF